jgi:hypothetical protein
VVVVYDSKQCPLCLAERERSTDEMIEELDQAITKLKQAAKETPK